MRSLSVVLLWLLTLSGWLALAPSGAPAATQKGRPRPPAGQPRGGAVHDAHFTLGGRVLFHQRMRPAVRVPVRLHSTGGGLVGMVFTDERGAFEFPGLGRGAYIVEVSEEGFQPVRQRVELLLGSRNDATILLEPQPRVAPATAHPEPVSLRELSVPPEARREFDKGLAALYEQQQPRRSLAHFRRAIELHPEFDEAYVQMALAHLRQGHFEPSRQALARATRLNPANWRAHTVLGLAWNQQRQWQRATQALEQAVALKEDFWHARYELGKALEQLGRIEEAYAHALRAHQLHPARAGVHLLCYNLRIRRGDYRGAAEELDEFLQRFPEHPKAAELLRKRQDLRQVLAAEAPR